MAATSPTDPYESCLVSASAGSGKTHQLTRRFLHLVAAGAKIDSILSITFTVKAAMEMRSRIIAEAARLLYDTDAQAAMDAELMGYYAHQSGIPKPIGAKEAARAILAATQCLQISTMDSVFLNWVAKFPWEASHGLGVEFPSPFELIDSIDAEEIAQKTWMNLFRDASWQSELEKAWKLLATLDPEQGVFSIQHRLQELARHNTFLWTNLMERGSDAYVALPKPEAIANEEQLIASLQAPLCELIEGMSRREDLLQAVHACDLRRLRELRLITREGGVSQNLLRGKKREAKRDAVILVENAVKDFLHAKAILALNGLGKIYFNLYQLWQAERARTLRQEGYLEFLDLAKGSYALFRGERGAGATWLIQKSTQHLLIDEFQDSSNLQWAIFSDIASELLSGAGAEEGIPPSVFFVGDPKQSIYGFREAEPTVLSKANALLGIFGKEEVALLKSYRSAPLILDFVNQVFNHELGLNFGQHEPALNADGSSRILDRSEITILNLEIANDKDPLEAIEREAKKVAQFLKGALNKRDISAKDICVLYRSSTHLSIFETHLRKANIPIRREDSRGFFNRVEILDALNMIAYLLNPNDHLALFALLKSPIFGIPDGRILYLFEQLREGKDCEALLQSEEEQAYRLLKELSALSREGLPHEVVFYVAKEDGLWRNYAHAYGEEEGKLARKNLLRLCELCVSLADKGYMALVSLYEQLQKMAKADQLASAKTLTEQVTMMTIHKAKGLEFKMVVLVDTGRSWFDLDPYWLKQKEGLSGVTYIGSKAHQPHGYAPFATLIAEEKRMLEAESIRLLYVALTRASHHLVISGHGKPGQGFYPLLRSALLQIPSAIRKDDRICAYGRDQGAGLTTNDMSSPPKSFLVFPKSTNEMLPVNCEVISPHAIAKSRGAKGVRRHKDPKLAVALGNFIHYALQRIALKQNDWQDSWYRIVQSDGLMFSLGKDAAFWAKERGECLETIDRTIQHWFWLSLLKQAKVLLPEQGIMHYLGKNLIRGQMDLYLEWDDQVVILDYKSHHLPEETSDLKEFCFAEGIAHQLFSYGQAVRVMRPNAKISLIAWFTEEPRWVIFGDDLALPTPTKPKPLRWDEVFGLQAIPK